MCVATGMIENSREYRRDTPGMNRYWVVERRSRSESLRVCRQEEAKGYGVMHDVASCWM
jgi:very-short-patch-repair endonuclease